MTSTHNRSFVSDALAAEFAGDADQRVRQACATAAHLSQFRVHRRWRGRRHADRDCATGGGRAGAAPGRRRSTQAVAPPPVPSSSDPEQRQPGLHALDRIVGDHHRCRQSTPPPPPLPAAAVAAAVVVVVAVLVPAHRRHPAFKTWPPALRAGGPGLMARSQRVNRVASL